MYDYLGYNQSSCIGGEVRDPAKTIPRSIVVSIVLVALLYVSMQLGVLGAIPWQSIVPLADGSLPPLGQHVASAVVERAFGPAAAVGVTLLILVTAFASVYGNLLGYSRVPYAAALDGVFLRPFAHVHGKHRFPDVSLVAMGLLALPACLFPLDQVINALTTGIVLIQSIAQIAALALVRRRGDPRAVPDVALSDSRRSWRSPVGRTSSNKRASCRSRSVRSAWLAGVAVFLVRAARAREWPFAGIAATEINPR